MRNISWYMHCLRFSRKLYFDWLILSCIACWQENLTYVQKNQFWVFHAYIISKNYFFWKVSTKITRVPNKTRNKLHVGGWEAEIVRAFKNGITIYHLSKLKKVKILWSQSHQTSLNVYLIFSVRKYYLIPKRALPTGLWALYRKKPHL